MMEQKALPLLHRMPTHRISKHLIPIHRIPAQRIPTHQIPVQIMPSTPITVTRAISSAAHIVNPVKKTLVFVSLVMTGIAAQLAMKADAFAPPGSLKSAQYAAKTAKNAVKTAKNAAKNAVKAVKIAVKNVKYAAKSVKYAVKNASARPQALRCCAVISS